MIKHLIMDIDGVLNTGHFIYSEQGKMFKVFGPHDKDGINLAIKLGLSVDFVTADETGFPISKARIVKDWKFSENNLHLVGEGKRLDWMKLKFDLSEVAYIGDGIHDVPILESVELGIAPNSGRREAKRAAKYVTESNAGSGAVLDACLIIEEYMQNQRRLNGQV
jgi:3-deoxy-D-manno-octulosonate 8-phosphate phosphatase (KDO 8-P phosphatase)